MPQENPIVQTMRKLLGRLNAATAQPPQRTVPSVPAQAAQPSARDYFTEGNMRQNRGDNDGAIALYNEAIRLNPRFGKAYWQRHEAFYNKHDYRQAASAITEWMRVFPNDPSLDIAYSIRGAYCAYDRNWDGAIADFTEALRYNPQDADTCFSRGLARQKKGDQAGAEQDFATARRMGYTDADLPVWAE